MGSTCTIERHDLDLDDEPKPAPPPPKTNLPPTPTPTPTGRIGEGARLYTYPDSELGQRNGGGNEPLAPIRKVDAMNPYSSLAQKRFQNYQRGPHQTNPGRDSVYVYQNGNTYSGALVNGLREGVGEETTPAGDGYNGEWKNDMKHGRGVMVLANGDHYVGDFIENRAEGNGVFYRLFDDERVRYEGEFVNGLEQGKGVETYPDQSHYDGDFVQNEKHGKGTFTFQDQSKFIGDFKHDIISGHGKSSELLHFLIKFQFLYDFLINF